jgi:ParB-like chromosome segregation protein Spo0J
MELKIEYIDIDKIKPYEKNPRHNEEAIPYVMNSIKEFGFKVPIILDKNNVIIAGHTRLESAKRLGMKEVPYLYANDLTEEQVKAFRLADNKVSEKAEWNFELLQEELEDLDLDMEDFGFDIDSEIEKEFERKDLSDKDFEKYEVIITFKNENEVQEIYEKLTEEGYECRISIL